MRLLCVLLALCACLSGSAQDTLSVVPDTLQASVVPITLSDSVVAKVDSLKAEALREIDAPLDTTGLVPPSAKKPKRDHATWTPDPIRSMWIGLVFPGGGQIYNRKYWKLPVFYGGFLGCMYALTWNNQMLRDYSQAYLDIMDDDPNTNSYMGMLPLHYDITGKEERFKKIFKNKKDHFRKYRDMSVLAFIAVYALSVVDAYVDAELSTFDISTDLTLHFEPAVIDSGIKAPHYQSPKSFGLQCSLTF